MPSLSKKMNRNAQLIRMIKILRMMSRKKCSQKKLAELFRVHVKTIRRDFAAIAGAGIKIKTHDCKTYKKYSVKNFL